MFDVRTGERIRVAEDTVATMDSVSAAYRRLAPKVLNLWPPPGTTLTGLGTSSTQAVHAYTLGMQALNRGRTDSAGHFLLQANFGGPAKAPILALPTLIAMKRAAGRPQDLADVAALEELQRMREPDV